MIETEVMVTDMRDEGDEHIQQDDPFDIVDPMTEDETEPEGSSEPSLLESTGEQNDANWQSSLVSAAREKGLPQELIEQIEGASDMAGILSIISGVVQKNQEVSQPEAGQSASSKSDEAEFDIEMDEESAFDPDAVRAMRRMNQHYSKKIRELESRLSDRSSRDSLGTTSEFVKTLGSEWNTVFGTSERPNPGNIKMLEEAVQTIRAGYAARHKRLPGEQEVLNMALNTAFGSKATEIARNKINEKVSKRSSQIVSRPGTRTSSAPNPRTRATQGVADWFKARGIDPYGANEDAFQ
jgi:hypothetical protein